MVTVHRGMSCERTCEPTRPCCAPGCPNARPNFQGPNPYYNPGFRPPNQRPVFRGPNPYYGPIPYFRRWNLNPSRPIPPRPAPPSNQNPNNSDGTVRIGVGNRSSTDINIDVYDNLVTGGRRRVHLGSGNYAAGSNTGFIANNTADCDDLQIGVDNYSGGGDNNVRVFNNDFRGGGRGGFQRVRVGVGNYAGGSNRIVVGGSPPPPTTVVRRRRWWLF